MFIVVLPVNVAVPINDPLNVPVAFAVFNNALISIFDPLGGAVTNDADGPEII